VLGAEHPPTGGYQLGEQVVGPLRVPGLPSPAGEVAAAGQGVGVLAPRLATCCQ